MVSSKSTVLLVLLISLLAGCHSQSVQDQCIGKYLETQGFSSVYDFIESFDGDLYDFTSNALSFNDQEYKENCTAVMEKRFSLMRKTHKEARDCFKRADEIQSFENRELGNRIICTFEKEIRQDFFQAYNEVNCYKPRMRSRCVKNGKDYCNDDAIQDFWDCFSEEIVTPCNRKEEELLRKFYQAMLKYSSQNSYCGDHHMFVDLMKMSTF